MKFPLRIKRSSLIAASLLFFVFLIFQLERMLVLEKIFSVWDLLLLFFSRPGALSMGLLVIIINEKLLKPGEVYSKAILLFLVFFGLLATFSDQIFYQVFRTQLNLTFSEGIDANEITLIFDSVLKELSLSILFCLLLTTVSYFYLVKIVKDESSEDNSSFLITKNQLSSFVVYCLIHFISFALIQDNYFYKRASYPVFKIITDEFESTDLSPNLEEFDYKKVDTEELIFGQEFSSLKGVEDWNQQIEVFSHHQSNKNIILIILESVGSMQIAPKEQLTEKLTPNLFKNRENIIFFKNIYNTFPGTTRSHIPITTGGETITWGSVNRELSYKYLGPTLPGFFNEHDYRTGLFSSMNLGYENLNLFYKSLGFKKVFDPDDEGESFKSKYKLHSWGVDESIVWEKAQEWIDSSQKKFYLQFLTNSTHHPYAAPQEHLKKYFADLSEVDFDNKYTRYKTSLHYTDQIIRNMVKFLEKNNLAKNTMIFITGDHGQAFSKHHKGNWTHKNYLYDENIKNFLIVYDLSKKTIKKHFVSDSRGTLGNIFPTIKSLIIKKRNNNFQSRVDTKDSKNLLSKDYQQKLIFFHKNAHPEFWGIIDGQYKYIVKKMGNEKGELYNLEKDSFEQNNIILDNQNKIAPYKERIKSWYLKTNASFSEKLDNYSDRPEMKVSDLTSYGPKSIYPGIHIPGLPFIKKKRIHPREDMSIWTQGIAYPEDTVILYEFVSPTGKKRSFTFTYKKDWSSVKVFHRPSRPMEEGRWRINLYRKKEKIGSEEFIVSKDEKLEVDLFHEGSGIQHLSFGSTKIDGSFLSLDKIHPEEDMKVQLLIRPYTTNTKLFFFWKDPENNYSKDFYFIIKKGWNKSWVYHKPKELMKEGKWTLEIRDENGKGLLSKSFEVSKEALLLKPHR